VHTDTVSSARRLVTSVFSGTLRAATWNFVSSYFEILLVAPGRSSADELVRSFETGSAAVHRLTLTELAVDLARSELARGGLASVSRLGAEAIAARVAFSARSSLGYFKEVSRLAGFPRALSRTLGDLRLASVDPSQLQGAGPAGPDLALLLDLYETELEERRMADLAAILVLAREATETSSHRLLGLPLVWLDAPLDSLLERHLFAAISRRAPRVLACVNPFDEPLVHAMCDLLKVEPEPLDGPPSIGLEHVRSNLFLTVPAPGPNDGSFDYFSAPGEGLEAVEIARRILGFARQGIRFDQMAILVRNPERYQPMIEEALRRARIPAYFSRGTTRPDPAGRAFLALLQCAVERCSASRFAEYLSLDQTPRGQTNSEWAPPDDELLVRSVDETLAAESPDTEQTPGVRAPAGWEKLLVDAAVIGGPERWSKRLKGLEQEFRIRLSALREGDLAERARIETQLARLGELEQFALPLIDLLALLPQCCSWGEWIEPLSTLARSSLERPEGVLAVLAELAPLGEVGPASLEEVADVLSDRLRFLRREPPARRYGRVWVGSIDEACGHEFSIVFLPGLAEGLFPKRSLEDPLLLDVYRKEVSEALARRDDLVRKERFLLRAAVATARDRLIASYPRMDVIEARPRVPSFYALELPRAAEGRLPALADFHERAKKGASARLNWPAPPEANEAIDDAEYDLAALDRARNGGLNVRYLMEANAHAARSLRARWRRWSNKWTAADGLVTEDPEALRALESHRLRARAWSPSALQKYAVCPYQFSLYGIFGLRPREDAAPLQEIDPRTRGALFHEVQFALLGELRERKLLPVNSDRLGEALDAADCALDRVASTREEDLAPAIKRVWQAGIEDLRADLRGWLQHVAVQDDDWQPIHFELAFGLTEQEGRDFRSTIDDVELAEGARLRGAIDLVEKHATRGGLRITDHKTGKAPEQIPACVGGGKFLQPLLYSLAAEKLLGAQVECGRLFYSTHRSGYLPITIPLDQRSRGFASALLKNIDGAIAAGFLPPIPEHEACERCDYRPVCGPYEELRLRKKNNRDDERIEPLFEIRNMI